MVITRAWDSPAWQLDITLPHEGPLDDLTKIQVKHGTDALFAGLCDEIVRSVDGNGAFVSISARTPGALLCDNEALPKTYTDLTAQAYFNAELKTLGFTGLSLPNTTASAATFQLGKGHSVWEAFCILCFRLYGREPHITAGNTVVVETLTGDDPIIISNAVNETGVLRYCSLEYITRRSSPLSTIVYRDVGGAYSQLYSNPFGNEQQVRRNRYIIPAGEYTGNPALDAYRRVMSIPTLVVMKDGKPAAKTEKERALLDAVEGAVEKLRPEAQRQIKTRMFYPYISDSSFMAVCDDTLAIQALETNMPQYGVKYTHPVDKIRQIDVPVVNIGTFGRDGHMLTERVDMLQTFRNVPNISYEAIVSMLS